MKTIKTRMIAILAVTLLSPLASFAADSANPALGNAVPASAATRTVTISSATDYVNVNQGDVVTFEADGKTFTWQFDTLRSNERFDLAAIAPADVHVKNVRVYVEPNPIYSN